MPDKHDFEDLKAEARKLSGNPQALVFCDDEGYQLITPDHFPMVFLGRTAHTAMRKLRRLYKQRCSAANSPYSAEMFTAIRLHLMLARNEILLAQERGDKQGSPEGPTDVLAIFRSLCFADNQVIAAQKLRGFTDGKLLDEIRKVALQRRSKT